MHPVPVLSRVRGAFQKKQPPLHRNPNAFYNNLLR